MRVLCEARREYIRITLLHCGNTTRKLVVIGILLVLTTHVVDSGRVKARNLRSILEFVERFFSAVEFADACQVECIDQQVLFDDHV